MKIPKTFYLFLFTIFTGCKDDISNMQYRNENYAFYVEDGKVGKWLAIQPTSQNDLKKSHITYFFPNGKIYAEMEIIDSFPNRIVKFYNKNDKLNRITSYKDGCIVNTSFKDGLCTIYHSNLGHIKAQGKIKNNMRQGLWKFYEKNGKTIKEASEYRNDTLDGTISLYWKNGNLKNKAFFVKGKLLGEAVRYYKTGELEWREYRKHKTIHGTKEVFYKNGTLKSREKYWNGEITDTCTYFFENGNIKKRVVTNLDTLSLTSTGKAYTYYEDGTVKVITEVKNQKSHGDFIMYNEDGIMIQKSTMFENEPQGFFTLYHDSGIKKLEGYFDSTGYYDGKLKYFDKKGKLFKIVTLENGTPLDSVVY